jgi:hypothetical protein
MNEDILKGRFPEANVGEPAAGIIDGLGHDGQQRRGVALHVDPQAPGTPRIVDLSDPVDGGQPDQRPLDGGPVEGSSRKSTVGVCMRARAIIMR